MSYLTRRRFGARALEMMWAFSVKGSEIKTEAYPRRSFSPLSISALVQPPSDGLNFSQ